MAPVENLIFRFSGSEDMGEERVRLLSSNFETTGDELMGRWRPNRQRTRTFNDIACYEQLRREEGCVRVEIYSLRVRHTAWRIPTPNPYNGNKYCHGIQVTYKQWFRDGTTKLFECEPNFSSYGYYSIGVQDKVVQLQDDEYLTGLRVYQGEIVDGITFVTNLRQVHCGGAGGSLLNTMVSNPPHTRIVAFSGTYKGIWERVGYYAESFRWEIVGPFVLLRELVRQDRAHATDSNLGPFVLLRELVRQLRARATDNLLQKIVQSDEGVFRTIMSYM